MRIPEIVKKDPWLEPYISRIKTRIDRFHKEKDRLNMLDGSGRAYLYYGAHCEGSETVVREWAPNAREIYLLCDRSGWKTTQEYKFMRINDYGDWEIRLSSDILGHLSHYRIHVCWEGGSGDRIPAYARRVVQDPDTHIFTAQIWIPSQQYRWMNSPPSETGEAPVIYEAHVGMALESGGIGTFEHFRHDILPRIAAAGYNTIQLMALMEHPYYASFGYQVSSFFALSSRYGTPEEFKKLVDECHAAGIRIIMDLVHSHAVKNEVEGIGRQDGSEYLYFHEGPRGTHPAWDSRCFDYGKSETINFLLSNCRFWLEEYRLDGFRFDGVTSMIYFNHGLGISFGHYDEYFNSNVDEDAVLYLSLANDLIHGINPSAITIAEDMSGMPGMAAAVEDGGCGFDYRLTMGLPDFWIKQIKEVKDENWKVSLLWDVLNNRRWNEKHISYSESHDQALVGDKTIIFRLMDAAMYTDMRADSESLAADRGMAYYKLINLLTFSAGGEGYLSFMGNEFGHPEWIDFPREGNAWSFHYARRQWSLADNPELRYSKLQAFTTGMLTECRKALCPDKAELIHCHDSDGVIAYLRGGVMFIFNINPSRSFVNYGIKAVEGRWKLIFDTDSLKFGGHGRLPETMELETVQKTDRTSRLELYLPSRTAVALERMKNG